MTRQCTFRLVFLLLVVAINSCSSLPIRSFALRPTKSRVQDATNSLDEAGCALDHASLEETTKQQQMRQGILWMIPVLSSIIAFVSFKHLTHCFDACMHALADSACRLPQTDTERDLQTQVITQVVNGPVITSISVLFATLVSTTVSSLNSRQLEIKSWFTKQVDELRLLQVIFKQTPPDIRVEAKSHVHDYTKRLVRDERGDQMSPGLDPSLRELLLLLQTAMESNRNQPVLGMAYEIITRIQQARCSRWTALQTKFPAMHYVTLTLLAVAICISFLVATDQSQMIFESVQVRILWTILVGSFMSLAVVCYDLSSPFVGAYHIVTSKADDELSILFIDDL